MDEKLRNKWVYDLICDNKPLPLGTRIKCTSGGLYTGETVELTNNALEHANKIDHHLSDYVPFWILAWKDLHKDLIPPNKDGLTDYDDNEFLYKTNGLHK